jgi:hypothetical protein
MPTNKNVNIKKINKENINKPPLSPLQGVDCVR